VARAHDGHGVALMLWLLIKGVDVAKWQQVAALAESRTV
jgi:hypothetical protein